MMTLNFYNTEAQAWFRSCLHRESAKPDSKWEDFVLLAIREDARSNTILLVDDEAEAVLEICESRLERDDEVLWPARLDIINQLKTGLKEAA